MPKKQKKISEKKFKHEFILNKTASDHQLTRPAKVGPTMDILHEYNPKSIDEWRRIYFEKSVQKKKNGKKVDEALLESLGQELFMLLTNKVFPAIQVAMEELTEDECKRYINDVVIRRSFEGYLAEKDVAFQIALEFDDDIDFEKDPKLEPKNIDWNGVSKKYEKPVGLSVKPLSHKRRLGYNPEEELSASWRDWEVEFGGKVFPVYYTKKKGKKKDKKIIKNKEEIVKNIIQFLES